MLQGFLRRSQLSGYSGVEPLAPRKRFQAGLFNSKSLLTMLSNWLKELVQKRTVTVIHLSMLTCRGVAGHTEDLVWNFNFLSNIPPWGIIQHLNGIKFPSTAKKAVIKWLQHNLTKYQYWFQLHCKDEYLLNRQFRKIHWIESLE